MRRHLHCLIIVPLFVIVMTWPAFIRVFDSDEFWLRTWDRDIWLNYWNAWHVESVLAGKADYYYSDAIFHPGGLSLAFKHIALPHALLFLVFEKLMPADDAYGLLYLLMLCFNAFGAYVLIQHLLRDKWIALFGALVAGLNPNFLQGSTTPDLILTGTLPLTIYCLHRSVLESRWRFAALAGVCAGFSAFISMYIFVFTLLSVAVYVIYLAGPRWRSGGFWRHILLFGLVCAAIGAFRVYPMLADRALLQEGLASYHGRIRSNDVLDYFIHSENPLTAGGLHRLFNTPPDASHTRGYPGLYQSVPACLRAAAAAFSPVLAALAEHAGLFCDAAAGPLSLVQWHRAYERRLARARLERSHSRHLRGDWLAGILSAGGGRAAGSAGQLWLGQTAAIERRPVSRPRPAGGDADPGG